MWNKEIDILKIRMRRFHRIWNGIKNRCKNIYNITYWWKWISYDKKWELFEWFKKDMFMSYIKHVEEFWEKQTTIGRIDNNWDYCKENCKRSTYKEQNNNKKQYIYKWKIFIEWICYTHFYKKYWYSRYIVRKLIDKWMNAEYIHKYMKTK